MGFAMVGRRRIAKELLQLAASRRSLIASPVREFPAIQQFHQNGSSIFSRTAATLNPKPAFRAARGLATAATATLPAKQFPWYGRYVGYTLLLGGSAILTYYYYPHPQRGPRARPLPSPEEHTVTNWSGTHSATTRVYVQPESLHELEVVVKLAHEQGQKIRPVGSGLSPNGIGLCEGGMIDLCYLPLFHPTSQTLLVELSFLALHVTHAHVTSACQPINKISVNWESSLNSRFITLTRKFLNKN